MKNIKKIISVSVIFLASHWCQAQAQDKPNVVLLFADDLGWVDVSTGQTNGGRGSKIFNTPNIDKIAQQGMSFTHAYTQQNCSPTRASLISGQYATGVDNGVYNVRSLKRQDKRTKGYPNLAIEPHQQRKTITEDVFNIFDMAQSAGYKTALIGKSHGTPHPLVGDFGLDLPADIHHIIKAKVNGDAVTSHYMAVKDDQKGWTFNSEFINKAAKPYDEKYINDVLAPFKDQSDLKALVGTPKHLTDAIGDYSVDFIQEKVAAKQPFFLYVPFHAVHTKVVGRKDLTEKYAKQGLDAKNAEYASMIALLDQNIGKIEAALKDPNGDGDTSDDISKNTIFIVYSDNGGQRENGPLTGGKGVFTEGGIRVPLIFRWPDVIPPNTISDQSVHVIDFFPTLAQMMGVDVNKLKKASGESVSLDGVSFADVLFGKKQRLARENLFWHFPGYMGSRIRPSTMVQKRVGDDYYKLFYNYETEEYLMYHINNDISEKHNLLVDPSPKELKLALLMNQEMTEWLISTNAPTGTWVKDGKTVPYPVKDGVNKYSK